MGKRIVIALGGNLPMARCASHGGPRDRSGLAEVNSAFAKVLPFGKTLVRAIRRGGIAAPLFGLLLFL